MSRARIINHSQLYPDYDPSKFVPGQMPKGWKSPRSELYRVCVQDREQGAIYVTPGVVKEVAEFLCDFLKKQIKTGVRDDWTNPSVELCYI